MKSPEHPPPRPPNLTLNWLKQNNRSSRQPRRLKFNMQAYFNPTKRNMREKKMKSHNPPPSLTLNRVRKSKSSSRQPRGLKFDMQAFFNPTKRIMKEKNEVI